MEYTPDNLYRQIENILDKRLVILESYTGKVKEVNKTGKDKGYIKVWSLDINGATETDSALYVLAKPSLTIGSEMIPDVGDYVKLRYRNENQLEYYAIDYDYQSYKNTLDNARVVFAYKDMLIYYNASDDSFKIKLSSDVEILLEKNPKKITFKGDVVIKGKLDVDKDISWNAATLQTHASTHTHMTPAGISASPTPGS